MLIALSIQGADQAAPLDVGQEAAVHELVRRQQRRAGLGLALDAAGPRSDDGAHSFVGRQRQRQVLVYRLIVQETDLVLRQPY
jgi:hypothetical protein